MDISKYRLQDIPTDFDTWEFVYSLVFLREIDKPINILEIGNGNFSLLYAIATEFEKKINSVYSVDIKNQFSIKDKNFYNKKIVFNTIHDRGCQNVFHEQKDCFDDSVLKDCLTLFSINPINFLIIEYMVDDDYMNRFFSSYNHLFGQKIQVFYHNLNKNENSKKYFDNLNIFGKRVIVSNNPHENGIALILDSISV